MFFGYAFHHQHTPNTTPLSSLETQDAEKDTEKIPLIFSSLVFLVFSSLFLNYLFLLAYLIMELVAYFYGYFFCP